MKLNTFSRCLGLALLAMVPVTASWALGLGEVQIRSAVGQPLVADVELLADASELSSLRLTLAPSGEYQLQGLEYNAALVGARVIVKKNDAGRTIAQIITSSSVSDPYVQVILDGETANGKVRRAYSLFIDPSRRIMSKLPGEGSYTEITKPVNLPPLQAATPYIPPVQSVTVAPTRGSGAASMQQPASDEPTSLTNVVQRGEQPSRIDVVKGYGSKQSISHALFTIVPKGWKGFASDSDVKFAQPVTWAGNRNWLVVLDGVLASANLMASVDWSKKEITFSSLATQASSQPQPSASPAAAVASGQSSMVPVAMPSMPPVNARTQAAAEQAVQNSQNSVIAASAVQERQLRGQVTMLERQLADETAARQAAQNKPADSTELEQARAEVARLTSAMDVRSKQLEGVHAKLDQHQSRSSVAESRVQTLTKDLEAARSMGASAQSAQAAHAAELAAAVADRAQQVKLAQEAAAREQASLREAQALKIRVAQLENSVNMATTEGAQLRISLEAAQQRLSAQKSVLPTRQPEAVSMNRMPSLSLIGPVPAPQETIGSAGLNTAFSSAIKQIVPAGWMVESDPAIGNSAVGWVGNGRPWTLVLDELLQSQGLKATIDSVAREVKIRR